MTSNIRLKRSSVAGKIPDSSDLEYGELALNYADGILYYKDTTNAVASISGGGGASVTTDSAAPTDEPADGDLWWDATTGKLKVYYDDGTPTSSPITVSLTVNSTYTTNTDYSFDTGWTDRSQTASYTNGDAASLDPGIVLQAGDTLSITNSEFANHPLYLVTQLDTFTQGYNSSYNVALPASSYGGGTSSVSYQFNSAGTYYYVCGVHPDMKGTITVLSAATASKQWVDAFSTGRGYTGSAGAITYSDTAPSNPASGQIWFDSTSGKSYIWYVVAGNGSWVLFADPTVTDGDIGYSGSVGYTGSRGTISPRVLSISTPQTNGEHTLLYAPSNLTLTNVTAVIVGGTSVQYTIRNSSTRNAGGTLVATDTCTNTTTGQVATISSSSISANDWIWVELNSVSGIVNEFVLVLTFTE